eukprot:g1326.t1 g1326   contig10:1866226-1867455(+)
MSAAKSSFSAFNDVDDTVAKPVLGSDGAARWQNFKQNSKLPASKSSVAPALPLKRLDRALGTKSLQDERATEAKVRKEAGDREVGAGYTEFSKKDDHEERIAKKARQLIIDRVRPDDAIYFIQADTFEGSKFDYVFTTRDRGTGYYWDGMDSMKKELGQPSTVPQATVSGDVDTTNDEAGEDTSKLGKKKKQKKRQREPSVVPESDPYNPMEQVAAAILRRKQAMEAPPTALLCASTTASDAVALGAGPAALLQSTTTTVNATTLEPELVAAGWESTVDPISGKKYYFRRDTNERSWTKPEIPKSTTKIAMNNFQRDGSLQRMQTVAKSTIIIQQERHRGQNRRHDLALSSKINIFLLEWVSTLLTKRHSITKERLHAIPFSRGSIQLQRLCIVGWLCNSIFNLSRAFN